MTGITCLRRSRVHNHFTLKKRVNTKFSKLFPYLWITSFFHLLLLLPHNPKLQLMIYFLIQLSLQNLFALSAQLIESLKLWIPLFKCSSTVFTHITVIWNLTIDIQNKQIWGGIVTVIITFLCIIESSVLCYSTTTLFVWFQLYNF